MAPGQAYLISNAVTESGFSAGPTNQQILSSEWLSGLSWLWDAANSNFELKSTAFCINSIAALASLLAYGTATKLEVAAVYLPNVSLPGITLLAWFEGITSIWMLAIHGKKNYKNIYMER